MISERIRNQNIATIFKQCFQECKTAQMNTSNSILASFETMKIQHKQISGQKEGIYQGRYPAQTHEETYLE